MVIIYHGIIKRKIEGDFLKVLKVIIPIVLILSLSSCMINSEEDVENTEAIISTPSSEPTSTPSPTPTEEPVKDRIIEMVEKMTIEQKIGQLVITGYGSVDEVINSDISFGGVILFGRNIKSVSETKGDIARLQGSFNIPLFISVDQEGGRVTRLPKEYGSFESALDVGKKNDPKYAYDYGTRTATALKDMGFNLNFAPVCDIFSNPDNTVIADRAYGKDPETVSKMAVEVLKGLRDNKIIPTAKHFPGHGDTSVDSHYGLPVVKKSLNDLYGFELVPFMEAIKNNVEMIMTGHIVVKEVDSLPSTLSKKLVTDLLRNEMNYKGVVITDDLGMNAISDEYSIGQASVMAFNAGCDIILCAQNIEKGKAAYNSLLDAFNRGEVSEERVNESVYRILKLKERYGIIG
jgi:beta-N-acetylhexosaminidase